MKLYSFGRIWMSPPRSGRYPRQVRRSHSCGIEHATAWRLPGGTLATDVDGLVEGVPVEGTTAGDLGVEEGERDPAARSGLEPVHAAASVRAATNNANDLREVTEPIRNTTAGEITTSRLVRDRRGSVSGVVSGRRLVILLVILAAIGVPAVALRAVCAAKTCAGNDAAQARVPFCPLPDALKADIAAGFRQGRSPDVLAVTAGESVVGGTDPIDATVAWPGLGSVASTRVPIVFWGTGIDPNGVVPTGAGLDRIAPTISDALGLRRPHPDVRAGVSLPGLTNGQRPRLVLEVALDGVGSSAIEGAPSAWPFLRSLLRRGAGTLRGTTGSLPLEPAATLTTIGTGGLPSQHGITGTFVRNDDGAVVRAWGDGAPVSVISTLPEDLDHATRERSMIGLVGTDPSQRGLIGGNWYLPHDRDAMSFVTSGAEVVAAEETLARGFGTDDVPDIMAVVLAPDGTADVRLRRLVAAAERASKGSVLVAVAGTGQAAPDRGRAPMSDPDLVDRVERAVAGDRPIVQATVPGGLFLDQRTLTAEHITGDAAVQALLGVTTSGGQRMMADAFQGFAVSFAKYC